MAATTDILEYNGTSGAEVGTSKSSGTIRMQAADRYDDDTANPLVIPASDQIYSYQKFLSFTITGGSFTQITNVKFYTDGANGFSTGVKLWGDSNASYATPAAPSTGDDPPHYSAVDMTDAFTYTSGSPLTLGAGPYTTTGDKGDYLILVMEVESSATTSGSTGSETMTIGFDEI